MQHVLDSSDPAYLRGTMAARIAVRDAPDPDSLALLHRHATSSVATAEEALETAESRVRYARGFRDHLTDLEKEREGA